MRGVFFFCSGPFLIFSTCMQACIPANSFVPFCGLVGNKLPKIRYIDTRWRRIENEQYPGSYYDIINRRPSHSVQQARIKIFQLNRTAWGVALRTRSAYEYSTIFHIGGTTELLSALYHRSRPSQVPLSACCLPLSLLWYYESYSLFVCFTICK